MATYTFSKNKFATLAPGVVDTLTQTTNYETVEIVNLSGAPMYFNVDTDVVPTIEGDNVEVIPPYSLVVVSAPGKTVKINLISAEGGKYKVGRPTGRTSLTGDTARTVISAENSSVITSTVQAKIREDFIGNALNPDMWTVVEQGAGQTITVTNSELRIDTGTTPNATTVIRSKKAWSGAYRTMFLSGANLLSQRIVNQNIELRMVSADGTSFAGYLFQGTSATALIYHSSNKSVITAGTNVGAQQSTNTPGVYEIEAFIDEIYFHTKAPDSTAGRVTSNVRNRNIPDPNEPMFIEIRVSNAATAPASNTRLSIDSILVQDISELTTEITAGRGGGGASQSVPVSVTSLPTASVRNIVDNSSGATAVTKIISTATTNALVLRATANSRFYGWHLTNTGTVTRYVKFYNKLTTPTVGTDVPFMTIAIPPGQISDFINTHPLMGAPLGLGMAITAGPADNDAVAIGAGEIVGTVIST